MVNRERNSVVGNAADQDQRIYRLPVVIAVCAQSLEIRFGVLPSNGVHGSSARYGESIINVVPGLEFARLIARSDDKSVLVALNQLLGFGEIDDLLTLVSLLILGQARGLNLAEERIEEHGGEIPVGNLQRVMQSP